MTSPDTICEDGWLWAVWAEPPPRDHLPPRFQMVHDGDGTRTRPFTYATEAEAKAWADACNADRNGWRYSAKLLAVEVSP